MCRESLSFGKPVICKRVQEGFQVLFFLFGKVQWLGKHAIAVHAIGEDGVRVVVIVYYLAQGFELAIVHVWCGNRHISQPGHFHLTNIGRVFCDMVPAGIIQLAAVK